MLIFGVGTDSISANTERRVLVSSYRSHSFIREINAYLQSDTIQNYFVKFIFVYIIIQFKYYNIVTKYAL